jgi:phosphate:Na+ symporter
MGQQFYFDMISGVIGGLCIFLLGMKNMSEGVQAVAGERLRRMIAAVTDNRLVACGTGAAVTSLIQSSSVTTVMLVGLVNAGVMTLMQAIGVILGADLGTTITAWIVALKVTQYGLPLLGISGLFYLFTKNERVRFTAMIVMGIGMIFFGLQLMKLGLEPLREHEQFVGLFCQFRPTDYLGVVKCVLVGSLVTAVVQSSSATVAITITLARTEVITYDTAVALVLGQNIGTTITAFLASLGTTTNARRVAYAHILIKVLGVALIVPFFFLYVDLLGRLVGDHVDIAKRIALAHTVFNVLLVCCFLPPAPLLAALLRRTVPDKPFKEPPALTRLDVRLIESPMVSIEQSRREVLSMGESVGKMLSVLREVLADGVQKQELIRMLFRREEILDTMQKEIAVFLTELLAQELPHAVAKEIHEQLRRADEYESTSDAIVGILKLYLRLANAEVELDDEERRDLFDIHEAVYRYHELVYTAHLERNTVILTKARPQGDAITHLFRDMRGRHLAKLSARRVDPLLSTVYPDILSGYRRVKDHLLNVAEAVAGEK